MNTVAVIGAGDLGGATAHALAASDGVGRVLIVDPSSGKAAAGKALDIRQAGAIAGFHTRVEGTDDLTRVTSCRVCVIADRFGENDGTGEWRGDAGLAMLAQLLPALSGVPIVLAGPTQDSLIHAAAVELGVSRHRLIGSAPEGFVSALRAIIALEAECSPTEVSVALLGRPPRGLVVPWSDASIGGHTLEHRLHSVQITRLENTVDRLWPPGPYALGEAAARVALAVVASARRAFSVLTILNGEFGVKNSVGIIQARLSPSGISETRVPLLTSRESVKVMSALSVALEPRGR
jgi:malate dehydrogenase